MNSRDELVLNDHARRMAEYYGCAVVPARPRKPRDKGAVESAVRLIEQNACAPLRDRVFVSLADLNGALLDKVRHINEQPFQKKDGSRDEIFFAQEKPYLTPLPMKPYEIVTRRRLTVNFNYHVSFDGGWYSIPYTYVKREVDVCATSTSVWIICDGERIAQHRRLHGPKGGYSTVSSHMPDAHRDFVEWDTARFRSWAEEIGPSCEQVIDKMLASRPFEQQAYRGCRSLLGLAEKYGAASLEAACEKALLYCRRPSYKSVKSLLAEIAHPQKEDPNEGAYLRGSAYYQNNQ